MIKGAIFDLDGVLLDSMAIWKDLGGRYLKKLGITPQEGLNDILFSMSMEQGAEYLQQTYMLPLSAGEILQGIEAMLRDYYFYEVPSKDGAREVLTALQEHKVLLSAATSSPREHITHALERNGLLAFFEGRIYTTGEVGVSKHQPDIYLLAAQAMHTQPKETLVFEDSLYALETARNAGFRAVGVYDANGEGNQEGLKAAGEVYLSSLPDFLSDIDRF